MLYIVNYHYIRNEFDYSRKAINGITPIQFREQLKYLRETGEVLKPTELSHDVFPSKNKYILITFDDGLREQFDNAIPILDSLNYQALFFVNTSGITSKIVQNVHKIHLIRNSIADTEFLTYIKNNLNKELDENDRIQALAFYRFDDINAATVKYLLNIKLSSIEAETITNQLFNKLFDEKIIHEKLYMSESQIVELGQKGMIGSHSHNHVALGNLSEDELKNELRLSKSILENLTNAEIKYISYPYGSGKAISDMVFRTAESIGYQYGFTTKPEINHHITDLLSLNRFDCNDAPGGKNINTQLWK